MRSFLFAFFFVFFVLITNSTLGAQEGITLRAQEIIYNDQEEKIEAQGNVSVQWGEANITTEQVVYYLSTSQMVINSPFFASFSANTLTGNFLFFDFRFQQGWVKQAELAYEMDDQGVLYFRGEKIDYLQGKWEGKSLLVSSCPCDPPFYSVRAQEVTIFPDQKVVIEGLSFFIRDRKVIELPTYARILGGEGRGSTFIPTLGYREKQGFYLKGYYESLLTTNLLFQAELLWSSNQNAILGLDLSRSWNNWEARIFWDIWQKEKNSWGAYLGFKEEKWSFYVVDWINQRIGEEGELVSRSPQFILNYRGEIEENWGWGIDLSSGFFEQDDRADWKNDLRGTVFWEEVPWEASFSLHRGVCLREDDFWAFSGEIGWADQISSQLRLAVSYQFTHLEGAPFFSFDPQEESLIALDLLWGKDEASFLRLKADYDFFKQDWDTITAGLALGNEEINAGMEAKYSFFDSEWLEKRYFLRRTIDDCVKVEASWWEEEQSFFLGVELKGLDFKAISESLFTEEEEEFDLFTVEREEIFVP